MGYTPKRTLYKLDFSQTEHAGLEVVTRSASMATLLAILELAEVAESAPAREQLAKMDELLSLFERVLVEWNVEDDDGQPVPADKGGLLSQDPEFVLGVIVAWGREMTQAPPTSPTASGAGATSVPEGLAEASRPSSSGRKSLSAWRTGGTARRRWCWSRTRRCCGCWTCTSWEDRRAREEVNFS